MNMRSKIVGVGKYLPTRAVTNHDLEKLMDTNDEWIVQRSGIKTRYWVTPEQSTTDLALEASKAAIANANMSVNDIDMIIFATLSPDHEFPGCACFLQHKLGRPGIPCLDIRQQCTGFLHGMSIADAYIRTGQYKNILLVGAEVHSKGLDLTSRGRDVSVLFGDGAGAAVISRTEVNSKTDSQIMTTYLYADGTYAKELWTQGPGTGTNTEHRLHMPHFEEGMWYPKMNGKKVFVHAIRGMSEVTVECIKKNGYELADVDLFVFHQANIRINEAVADALKLDPAKVFNTIEKYGNTTAATIPIGLTDAVAEGKLKKGMLVCSASFGSGFTWGATLYRW